MGFDLFNSGEYKPTYSWGSWPYTLLQDLQLTALLKASKIARLHFSEVLPQRFPKLCSNLAMICLNQKQKAVPPNAIFGHYSEWLPVVWPWSIISFPTQNVIGQLSPIISWNGGLVWQATHLFSFVDSHPPVNRHRKSHRLYPSSKPSP